MIGLQEVKVADEQFPFEDLEFLNYRFDTHGQKGHYGVALASKPEPLSITRGFSTDSDDAQRRMIRGVYALADGTEVTVFNGYFPRGISHTPSNCERGVYHDLLTTMNTEYSPTDHCRHG